MFDSDSLNRHQDNLKKLNQENHSAEIDKCYEAIDLFLEIWDYLSQGSKFDMETADGASKAVVWRFICSIPSTALWCLDAARKGQVGIAGTLQRLLIEEAYSVLFFAAFPEEALKQVYKSPGKDIVNFNKKLDMLDIGRNHSLRRFHGDLSNKYVHANAILRPEFIVKKNDVNVNISGVPQYIDVVVPFFSEYVIRALSMSLGPISLSVFPELQNAPNSWFKRTIELMNFVTEDKKIEE